MVSVLEGAPNEALELLIRVICMLLVLVLWRLLTKTMHMARVTTSNAATPAEIPIAATAHMHNQT